MNGPYYGTSTNTGSSTGNRWTTFNFTIVVEPPDDGLAGCYATLGIPPGSPPDAIRKAYRDKLKATHPDHGGSGDAVRKVIDAYRRLAPDAVAA